jgi:predicted ArsR family transcriptional regulator
MDYARKNLENCSSRAVDMLLMHLKTHGACSTRALAEVLGVSSEAVRQHLNKLVAQGEVRGKADSAGGVGRPKQLWELTETGHARFPNTHAQLTVQIIRTIEQIFGPEGLERIVDRRGEEQLAAYRPRLASCATLGERVTRLAALRDEQGYMARVERDGDDFLLIEDHCPICAAAAACQRFCATELAEFRALMQGWADVTREEHLLHNAKRCVYRLRAVQVAPSMAL